MAVAARRPAVVVRVPTKIEKKDALSGVMQAVEKKILAIETGPISVDKGAAKAKLFTDIAKYMASVAAGQTDIPLQTTIDSLLGASIRLEIDALAIHRNSSPFTAASRVMPRGFTYLLAYVVGEHYAAKNGKNFLSDVRTPDKFSGVLENILEDKERAQALFSRVDFDYCKEFFKVQNGQRMVPNDQMDASEKFGRFTSYRGMKVSVFDTVSLNLGATRHEGRFSSGRLNGYGLRKLSNGIEESGTFVDGELDGAACSRKNPNGTVEIGQFDSGKFDGGTDIQPNIRNYPNPGDDRVYVTSERGHFYGGVFFEGTRTYSDGTVDDIRSQKVVKRTMHDGVIHEGDFTENSEKPYGGVLYRGSVQNRLIKTTTMGEGRFVSVSGVLQLRGDGSVIESDRDGRELRVERGVFDQDGRLVKGEEKTVGTAADGTTVTTIRRGLFADFEPILEVIDDAAAGAAVAMVDGAHIQGSDDDVLGAPTNSWVMIGAEDDAEDDAEEAEEVDADSVVEMPDGPDDGDSGLQDASSQLLAEAAVAMPRPGLDGNSLARLGHASVSDGAPLHSRVHAWVITRGNSHSGVHTTAREVVSGRMVDASGSIIGGGVTVVEVRRVLGAFKDGDTANVADAELELFTGALGAAEPNPMALPGSSWYRGRLVAGRMFGIGILRKDGIEYRGTFDANELLQGPGVRVLADGTEESGTFKDGVLEGSVVRKQFGPDGTTMEEKVQFARGKPSGAATRTYHSLGVTESLNYKDGRATVSKRAFIAKKIEETGEFDADKLLHGNGVRFDRSLGLTLSGTFENGVFIEGIVEHTFGHVVSRKGKFDRFLMLTEGIINYRDGRIESGYFDFSGCLVNMCTRMLVKVGGHYTSYYGNFKGGVFELGHHTEFTRDGDIKKVSSKLVGTFDRDGKLNGTGIHITNTDIEQKIEIGEFKSGALNGDGYRCTRKNGKLIIQHGRFENGTAVGVHETTEYSTEAEYNIALQAILQKSELSRVATCVDMDETKVVAWLPKILFKTKMPNAKNLAKSMKRVFDAANGVLKDVTIVQKDGTTVVLAGKFVVGGDTLASGTRTTTSAEGKTVTTCFGTFTPDGQFDPADKVCKRTTTTVSGDGTSKETVVVTEMGNFENGVLRSGIRTRVSNGVGVNDRETTTESGTFSERGEFTAGKRAVQSGSKVLESCQGTWVGGVLHGDGTRIVGQTVQRGRFINGIFVCGTETKDGVTREGVFLDGKLLVGSETMNNGVVRTGSFDASGKLHGVGTETTTDGTTRGAVYRHGTKTTDLVGSVFLSDITSTIARCEELVAVRTSSLGGTPQPTLSSRDKDTLKMGVLRFAKHDDKTAKAVLDAAIWMQVNAGHMQPMAHTREFFHGMDEIELALHLPTDFTRFFSVSGLSLFEIGQVYMLCLKSNTDGAAASGGLSRSGSAVMTELSEYCKHLAKVTAFRNGSGVYDKDAELAVMLAKCRDNDAFRKAVSAVVKELPADLFTRHSRPLITAAFRIPGSSAVAATPHAFSYAVASAQTSWRHSARFDFSLEDQFSLLMLLLPNVAGSMSSTGSKLVEFLEQRNESFAPRSRTSSAAPGVLSRALRLDDDDGGASVRSVTTSRSMGRAAAAASGSNDDAASVPSTVTVTQRDLQRRRLVADSTPKTSAEIEAALAMYTSSGIYQFQDSAKGTVFFQLVLLKGKQIGRVPLTLKEPFTALKVTNFGSDSFVSFESLRETFTNVRLPKASPGEHKVAKQDVVVDLGGSGGTSPSSSPGGATSSDGGSATPPHSVRGGAAESVSRRASVAGSAAGRDPLARFDQYTTKRKYSTGAGTTIHATSRAAAIALLAEAGTRRIVYDWMTKNSVELCGLRTDEARRARLSSGLKSLLPAPPGIHHRTKLSSLGEMSCGTADPCDTLVAMLLRETSEGTFDKGNSTTYTTLLAALRAEFAVSAAVAGGGTQLSRVEAMLDAFDF